MAKISLEELLEVGAHYGHQARRWNPKMAEYLYGQENGVHLFDLTKTKPLLESALDFLKESAAQKKSILFLGTKKQIKEKIREVADATGYPFVSERWLGGTISNFEQMRKSIRKLEEMKAGVVSGAYSKYTKKERLLIDREISRLERFFGGLKGMESLPDVLFVVDVKREFGAVKEARNKGIKIVGIVDSNADPEPIDYVIPMNDDAARAVSYVLDLAKEAILEGKDQKPKVKSKKAKSD
jgi:small subunit ribosomal protein S2